MVRYVVLFVMKLKTRTVEIATVMRQVLGGAGRLIAIGALVGFVLAVILARSISTFLFGVRPFDPVTSTVVIALLAVTAATASAIPAFRASRVDPVVALRND